MKSPLDNIVFPSLPKIEELGIETSVKGGVVDMFPYRIKNVNNFYNRDHPEFHPNSTNYRSYWLDQTKKCLEGNWVKDGDRWVYLFPKLYFYINIGKIEISNRKKQRLVANPSLRDTEFIIFSYLFCCQGFSGFKGDDNYTCNLAVEKHNNLKEGEELSRLDVLTPDCYKKDGSLKTYINAWDYLTRFYLFSNDTNKNMGVALYENDSSNFGLLSARGIGKSFSIGVGDALHEFIFNSVKYFEDFKNVNDNKIQIHVGAANKGYLSALARKIETAFYALPGSYDKGNISKPSPYSKKLSGSWKVTSKTPLVHEYFTRAGRKKGSESSINWVLFTVENPTAGVGERPVRIYIDEFGLLKNALEVHGANKNSLIVGGNRFGIEVCTGTAGDIEKIQEPKQMFNNPSVYDFYPIPNYWENIAREIFLFIPATYSYDEFKDENGNTDLVACTEHILNVRKKLRNKSASILDEHLERMYRPIVPSEMFLEGRANILPTALASDRLLNIYADDSFKAATVGTIRLDKKSSKGVRFTPDLSGAKKPILDYNIDPRKIDPEGAVVIHEFPKESPEKNLYKIVYDCVRNPEGVTSRNSSLAAVLVYKGIDPDDPHSMQDTIVANWTGRYDQLEDMHDIVIGLALFYNAKIFPETNIVGFVDYCKRRGYWNLLQGYAHNTMSEALNDSASPKFPVGYNMSHKQLKNWCLMKLKGWLLESREIDPVTGAVLKRNIDFLNTPRILDEIVNFNMEDNYDNISALCGLMIWINEETKAPTDSKKSEKVLQEFEKFVLTKRRKKHINAYHDF